MKNILSLVMCASSLLLADDGLIARYRFNEGRGPIILDVSGNGNHAVIRGAIRWTEGVSGGALEFDGKTTHVECPARASLTAERPAQTIEVWVRLRATGKIQDILSQGWFHRLFLSADGSVTAIEQRKDRRDYMLREPSPSVNEAGTWHHIALVFEGAGRKDNFSLYVNGERKLVNTCSVPLAMAQPGLLKIGVANDGGGRLNGSIDELAVFSRALTVDEIRSHCTKKGDWESAPALSAEEIGRMLAGEYNSWFTGNFKAFITPNIPGGIYTAEEMISFTVAVPAAPDGSVIRTARFRITDVDGTATRTLEPLTLSPENDYSAAVEMKTAIGRGYYALSAVFVNAAGLNSKEDFLSFSVIPDVRPRTPDLDSPFGVATHFGNWGRDELPALQAKLGISWFRDGINYARCADSNELSPTLALAERNSLCWLPLFSYVNAEKGTLIDGTYRWDADIAKIRKTMELHKGKITIYESQNEPNNFGGWKTRFPAEKVWQADSWGKAFTDLVKAMTTTLRDVDPSAKMIWPELDVPDWTGKFASNWGAAPFIDIVAPHPYSLHGGTPEEQGLVKVYPDFLAMLDSHSIPREIWITELGYASYTSRKPFIDGVTIGDAPKTEKAQAEDLVRAFLVHRSFGVKKFFWYDLYCDGFDTNEVQHNFGLLRYGTMAPKPAAVAYANLVHQMRHAVYRGRITDADGAWALLWDVNGKPLVTAWRLRDTGTLTFKKVKGNVSVTDIYGRSSAIAGKDDITIPLTTCPVFISGLSAVDSAR
ncbi:MAG: LamG domain-containing protein [Spirochaetota bacterium]